MIGVIVNVITVIIGSCIGLLFKKGIPERVSNAAMIGLGACTLYIGISGSLCGENVLILIASVVLGAIVGTLLNIDGAINALAGKVESRFKKDGANISIAEGLVSDDALFRPNAPITREEMCKILVGFAIKKGKVSKAGAETLNFSDNDSISLWAKGYVAKASDLGLINGMGENCFMPKETATRAQVVTVIDRIMDN